MHEAFLVRHWHWKGASKAVVPHRPLRGNSKDVFKRHCYCTYRQWGRISKDILLYTDHWRGIDISKENVLHWPLRGKIKGQWYTLSTEGQSQRTNTHWSLSGNLKGCCYMYTLTFDGGSQKMLLHINNKRKSRMLIQILKGDLTHENMNIGDGSQQVNLCTHTQVACFWVLTSWPLGVRVGHWTSVYSADWLQMSQPS